jgi:hypothetical protein
MTFQILFIKLMNFNTRTIIDLIELDSDLKSKLNRIIDDERLFVLSMDDASIDETDFIITISPIIHETLKRYVKIDLRGTDLSFLKGMINLNAIDYKMVFESITQA